MLKKFASDALGLSDIGKIINPKDYNKVDADDYIMHEDEEKIFFLIKSRTDEYCFTNLAFIHVDGTSAISKKRLVKRYDYYKHNFSNASIETAGTVDLDCELKFFIDDISFSIDVDKNQIENLKDIYKTLIKIGHITESNDIMLNKSEKTLEMAVNSCGSQRLESGNLSEVFKEINEYAFKWIESSRERYIKKDFTDIFKKYINN
ncbi:hypothetical protein [Clostridium tertium]|uniref:YvbH-like oligomerisation region n=1 Tax=Clostridium tertium TaxID=1559 RepID=A0A6N3G213_9CLOT